MRILRRRRPDVVLGAGGYVAGPMVLAAGLLRIPAALTEADAHLGLANRFATPFARRVFLAFQIEGVDGPKYRVVGRPIPARSQPADKSEARKGFGLPEHGRAVLVFGGSLGARRLNQAALEAWGDAGPPVLHIAGERDFETLDRPTRADYVLLPFTDDFGAALSAVDLVVARAGGSVWEVAAAGKPALLVPYPEAAADHQTANARYFEQRRRRCRRPGIRARPEAAGRGAAHGRGAARTDGGGHAIARTTRRSGHRRGGADRACYRLTDAVSGSSASAAPG